ncbi:MAG: RtcB family protein [Methanobacteriota archaeon]|nr:MAG: RtcB family protein [Euryarchaeota archaeon]
MKEKLKSVGKNRWEIPIGSRTKEPRMRVPGRIIGSQKIIEWAEDAAIEQLTNVATLPGIVRYTVGMPDIHWGYGLPMGAVSAFDEEEGIISAGMTGFDINCGIRMIKTNMSYEEVRPRIKELINALFRNVPSGVGSKSRLRLTPGELEEVMTRGAEWAVEKGFGTREDLLHLEEGGVMEGADPEKVSPEAKKRGMPQAGTLGAGNHFLEIQRVEELYDAKRAEAYGLVKDNIVIMLHCGSRGFGHQIATDYLRILDRAVKKYGIALPDHQLVCAPATSQEGQDYFAAMKAGVNYAFANRQVMTHRIRESFEEVFKRDWQDLGMDVLYDVCHNICKYEEHIVDGEKRNLYVHRKGATRAFPPGHKDVPAAYRSVGQPVLIAGSMGTASYVLSGTEQAMMETFGSTCHGAGRAMSRKKAIKSWHGDEIRRSLEKEGMLVVATSPKVIAEEAPAAYKDVDEVVESVHAAGISLKVARLVPLAVAKG